MISNTLVSIVLPVHNGEKYLRESIESIVNQSLENWELIIVDDDSTDDTPRIIHSYANNDKRIRIVTNSYNLGLPASLNRGFKEAIGQYLTWTSDDNRYLPGALERMSQFLIHNNRYRMVCTNMYYIENDVDDCKEYVKYDENSIYISDSVGACFMYSRELLDTVGEYDPDMVYVEDYDYWLRILKYYGCIAHIDEFLYIYRRHSGSLTATKMTQIRKQHSRLMNREIEWVFNNIKGDESLIRRLYVQLKSTNALTAEGLKCFEKYLPEVLFDKFFDIDKPLILYGAGKIADVAIQTIDREKIAFFVDRYPEKYGGKKMGVPIISSDSLTRIKDNYNILITVGDKYIIEVIRELLSAGIDEFCTYDLFVRTKELQY